MSRSALTTRTRLLAICAATGLCAALVACTSSSGPSQSPASSTGTDVSTPAAPPASGSQADVLQPAADAQANLPFFTATAALVYNSAEQTSGRAYIDALVAAGFEKAAMQVTRDTTTVGDAAESIQFSVLWSAGQCMIGQVGPATGALVTGVFAAAGEGRCLLGDTRSIDW